MGAVAVVEQDELRPDVDQAARFLDFLASGEPWTFQTFDDVKGRQQRGLIRVLYGILAEHFDALAKLQALGAGVFVTVNRTDGKGRKTANITAVRAVFVDLDGSPLQPVLDAPLQPHVVVETSPGRFHAYWRVIDFPLSRFAGVQRGLAARFGGDPKVTDLPRVMRLPGFLHMKRAPYRSRILSLKDRPPYRLAELELAFPEPRPEERTRTRVANGKDQIPEGERNGSLLSMGATWRNGGLPKDGVLQRLRTANRERCSPPLTDSEVCAVLESVFRYPCEQGVMLSAQELHAMQAASGGACKVYLAAKVQHAAGNEHVSLTLKDMRAHGFSDPRTLATAIRNARTAHLVKIHRAAVYKRKGQHRLCALYELPLCAKHP